MYFFIVIWYAYGIRIMLFTICKITLFSQTICSFADKKWGGIFFVVVMIFEDIKYWNVNIRKGC